MIRTKYSKFDYLTFSESDDYWGLHVNGAGFADIPPNTIYPPTEHPDNYMFDWKLGRVLPEFAVVYISKGKGTFETKMLKKNINEGTILFLHPKIWHRYRPDKDTGWKEYWISFGGVQPNRLLEKNILQPNKPILEIGFNENLIQLFTEILELLENEKIGFREKISSLTYQIIADIVSFEKIKRLKGTEIEMIIKKAKILMMENIHKQLVVKDLCKELNVGYSRFRHLFQFYTHLSPSQYFLGLKLNRAKKILINSNSQIQQISDSLGFNSLYYFSKFFKKKTGVSPLQWRNLYQMRSNRK